MHRVQQTFLATIGLVMIGLLFGMLTLSAQVRVPERLPQAQETVPAPTPTTGHEPILLPPPESELAYTLEAGPAKFCPGWNVWYELSLTNVGALPVTNLLISDALPQGDWNIVDGYQGTVVGVYDSATRTMRWQVDVLQVGETAVISCVLHTSSTVADGSLFENTFTGTGFGLPEPLSISKGLRADSSLCAPAATPTSEPTPIGYVPTPDAPLYSVSLPIIVQ